MTSKEDMVYSLTTDESAFVYANAVADNRAENGLKRNAVPLSYYLINSTEEAVDLTDTEWQTLIGGGKVTRRYSEYDHEPGTIELTLTTQGGSYDIHEANNVGSGVEKYFLNVIYRPDQERVEDYHIGSYRTLQAGLAANNISRELKHTINVFKRFLTVKKTKMDTSDLTGAVFKIYQKDDSSGDEINTVTLEGGTAVWDYILPDEDQKVPGEYWKDDTIWYLREESAPEGYLPYEGEIPVTLSISDTKTILEPANTNNAQLYTWTQTANVSASGYDANYVVVTGNDDIQIAVKDEVSVDITVIKTDLENIEIAGAKFIIKKGSALMTDVRIVRKGGSWSNEEDRITIEDGVFCIPEGGVTITGLGPGEYTLKEVQAPDGYIQTVQPVKFKIENGVVTYQNEADNAQPRVTPANENKQYTIQNEPGAALPNTGGIGTRPFTILGSALIIAAGVLLWRRRRLI